MRDREGDQALDKVSVAAVLVMAAMAVVSLVRVVWGR